MKRTLRFLLALLFATVGAACSWAQGETTIPTYTTVTTDPIDGATVSAITNINISLSREGYDAPLGIMPGAAAVTAVKLNGTAEEPIEGVTAMVKAEKLIVSFDKPFNEAATVVVRIPEGLTNNLAMPVATMTTEEIIEEGGCTNPAINITLHVAPSVLPVKDVTGIGYGTYYLQDEDGNFVKDDKGQYIRVDKYDSLIDAQLQPANGDRVTVMYFWFDENFSAIDYKGGATVTNVTTGVPMGVADVSFKTGGDSHRNDVIELRLSTADYIYSEDLHQGVYEVVLPEGIATTANGLKSGGKTFRFTFGDPEQAYVPVKLDLDAYLGDYKAVAEEGEENPSEESFTLVKEGNDYFVTSLCGSTLSIPVKANGNNIELEMTEARNGEAFMSLKGGNVNMVLNENDDKRYIYLDQYALYDANNNRFVGGIIYFEQQPKAVEPEERVETESGVATGIFYAFYEGTRDIDNIPVAYTKYDDGAILLPGFANGKDLLVEMGDEDEYGCYYAIIDDQEGVGANADFTYEDYEDYIFNIYRFVEPVSIGPDRIEFVFLDGTTYYNPESDCLVLDYISAVDDDEYMFLIDFSMPYKQEIPDGLNSVLSEESTASIYDLQGRCISSRGAAHGIYVQNGRKVLK